MPIPPQFSALIDQVNEELDQLGQETEEALRAVRAYLDTFSGNVFLVRSFAVLSNIQFYVSDRRRRVASALDNVSDDTVQELGEDLGAYLGEIFDLRITVSAINRELEQ